MRRVDQRQLETMLADLLNDVKDTNKEMRNEFRQTFTVLYDEHQLEVLAARGEVNIECVNNPSNSDCSCENSFDGSILDTRGFGRLDGYKNMEDYARKWLQGIGI